MRGRRVNSGKNKTNANIHNHTQIYTNVQQASLGFALHITGMMKYVPTGFGPLLRSIGSSSESSTSSAVEGGPTAPSLDDDVCLSGRIKSRFVGVFVVAAPSSLRMRPERTVRSCEWHTSRVTRRGCIAV